jgi:tetratricopeptide (TPR) repeat protein
MPSFPTTLLRIIGPSLFSPVLLIATCQTYLTAQRNVDRKHEAVSSDLQEHYNAAQRFQQSGDFEHAAEEYRIFLADILGKLAMGHARAGDYSRAASLFDDALVLRPDSPELRITYAQAALTLGDLPHAETLTQKFIRDYPADPKGLAQAHQILGQTLLKMNKDKEARKELEAAVALDPTFENGYSLAVACLDTGDDACAGQIFSEMQKSLGDTPAIHMYFGRAYGESDFQQKAIAEFKKAIEEDTRFPGAHYCLAATYLSVGDDAKTQVAEAEIELKKELVLSPDDFLTYSALGKVAMIQRNYADAERYLKKATELNPNNPDAFLYLGQMYVVTGRTTDAEIALRQSIRLTTDESRNRYQVQKAHYLLGRLLMREGKEQEAHTEMQTAKSLMTHVLNQDRQRLADYLGKPDAKRNSGDSPLALKTTATDTDGSATREAIRELDSFQKQVSPAIADSYNNLGAISATYRDYSTAVDDFQRASEWNSSLEGLDRNWGKAAFSASKFREAIVPLSRYLRSHPDDQQIRATLGISQFMTKDYTGCILTLKEASASLNSPQVEYAYAESLVKTGQTSSGTERLLSLAKSHPEFANVHRALGELYAEQADKKKAIEELQTAIRLNPSDSGAHYDLGKLELDAGESKVAISELESAVRLQPNIPKFHQYLADAYKRDSRLADANKELHTYDALQKRQADSSSITAHSQDHPDSQDIQ